MFCDSRDDNAVSHGHTTWCTWWLQTVLNLKWGTRTLLSLFCFLLLVGYFYFISPFIFFPKQCVFFSVMHGYMMPPCTVFYSRLVFETLVPERLCCIAFTWHLSSLWSLFRFFVSRTFQFSFLSPVQQIFALWQQPSQPNNPFSICMSAAPLPFPLCSVR